MIPQSALRCVADGAAVIQGTASPSTHFATKDIDTNKEGVFVGNNVSCEIKEGV